MSVFDRTNTLAEEVADIEREIESVKTAQVVGNDNLIVNLYIAEIFSTVVGAGATALIKATFTYDTPSNSFVDRAMTFQVNSGSFSYQDVMYDDPATATSTTQKIWYYAFSVSAAADLYFKASARCTQTGTLVIERVS